MYTTMVELGPQYHFGDGFLGLHSRMEFLWSLFVKAPYHRTLVHPNRNPLRNPLKFYMEPPLNMEPEPSPDASKLARPYSKMERLPGVSGDPNP